MRITRFLLLTLCLMLITTFSCNRKTDNASKHIYSSVDQKEIKKIKPYRVLLIIGDQWTDPMSYNIDVGSVKEEDFIDITTMLKIWGIPFDILRLDQQRLQINRFLDGAIKPNYGCIIWMADPDRLEGYSANYETLKHVVEKYGISMIALGDYIKVPEVADLIGVNYNGIVKNINEKEDKFKISGDHYITNNLVGVTLPDKDQLDKKRWGRKSSVAETVNYEEMSKISTIECTIKDNAKELGSIGKFPQLVVRDVSEDTKVIWIGGGKDWFRKYPVMRTIFRNSLVYAMGYGIFNDNFENGFIFVMDDIGCSEHAWSLRWHYPTPSKETLIKYLIEPLEKYGKMIVQNVTPGYANPETQMIELPWTIEPFEDIFGNWQDYGSTKEGLDEGVQRGVFEIQPHRIWTHMNWDLDSPPGPWWTAPVHEEMAEIYWYTERVDARRGVPVPLNDLLFLYKTGMNAVEQSFGVMPLSAAASSWPGTKGKEDAERLRVAAIAGVGVVSNSGNFVSIDRAIEFSMMNPELKICHDLDLNPLTDSPADIKYGEKNILMDLKIEQLMSSKIAGTRYINPNLLENTDWIESHKDKYWMGYNELGAYLHTKIERNCSNGFKIELKYDPHYCHYFKDHHSYWTLELPFHSDNNRETSVIIDGKKKYIYKGSKFELELPAGIGKHTIEIH